MSQASNIEPAIAVVGATGLVGAVLLDILDQRGLAGNLTLLASARSVGKKMTVGNKALPVLDLETFDFADTDFALFSAGGAVSRAHAPRAAAAGAIVIDNTSEFRCREGIPLVVPEVNAHALQDIGPGRIVANPNCSTIQMVVALAPLHREFQLTRVNVATYQSISGAGRQALEDLKMQTDAALHGIEADTGSLPQSLAFNVIPSIDAYGENGYTREEMKMHNETRWMLEDDAIVVNATAVRVPTLVGHAEAVHAEFARPFTMERVRKILAGAPGVAWVDSTDAGREPTPARDGAGTDAVFVSRVRRDHSNPLGLNLWVVADNLRKGAALNAIQIMERIASAAAGNVQSAKVHSH